MANGALAEIKGTRASRVDLETILPGGAHVTPGGAVTFPDGTTATLQDGQMITMDGKISPAAPDFVAAANVALDAGTVGAGARASDRAAGASAAAAAAAMQSNQNGSRSDSSAAPGTSSSGTGMVQGNAAMGSGIGVRTISPETALSPSGASSPTEQNASALRSGRGRASTTNAGTISSP